MIVELENGASFAFPPRLVQGLHDASPAEIAEAEGEEGGTAAQGGVKWGICIRIGFESRPAAVTAVAKGQA